MKAGDINPTFNNELNRQTEDEQGGTSLVVQWLKLCSSNAGVMGLTPGQGTKISHDPQCQKKKKRKDQQGNILGKYYKST